MNTKKNLYIAMLDNGIDGARPYTVVAASLAAAKRIAASHSWAIVRDVIEAHVENDDAEQTMINRSWLLVETPNANRNHNPLAAGCFGYTTPELRKMFPPENRPFDWHFKGCHVFAFCRGGIVWQILFSEGPHKGAKALGGDYIDREDAIADAERYGLVVDDITISGSAALCDFISGEEEK